MVWGSRYTSYDTTCNWSLDKSTTWIRKLLWELKFEYNYKIFVEWNKFNYVVILSNHRSKSLVCALKYEYRFKIFVELNKLNYVVMFTNHGQSPCHFWFIFCFHYRNKMCGSFLGDKLSRRFLRFLLHFLFIKRWYCLITNGILFETMIYLWKRTISFLNSRRNYLESSFSMIGWF